MHKIASILRFLLRREKRERELDTELRFHIERQVEQNLRRGMLPEQARLAALRTVGGVEQIKEECRDARLGRAIETTLQDIRYGLRILLKNPGFSCAAVITLALGIGVNTAIFSVVYGVLLRPLPYQHGGQLVVLHQQATRAHLADIPFSTQEIFDYRDHNHTLDAVVEHHTMSFLLLGKDTAERVQTAVVSANFFDVLGVKPLLGRTFVASDEAHNADAVLVLSYKYWQTRYGGNPNIVGKVFQMNNRPHTVIGVLPAIPQYPTESDVYMPTSQCPFRSSPAFIQNRQARMMNAFGRLKPGMPLKQAQADLATIASQLEKSYPDVYQTGTGYTLAVAPLRDDLTRRARTTFLVLLGAAGFVLLIACANVANLLLARLLKLERELAVRAALGASKARLVRQLLTESILLSITGGALGLALAPTAVTLLSKFAERFTTRATEVRIDAPVLLFTICVSLVTGLLFGLAPAFSSGRYVTEALKQGTGRTTAGPGRQRLRGFLVVAQVAVSFMLLIGAGLMIRSFVKLQDVNPGFNPDRLLTLRLTPNFSRYSTNDQFITLWHKVLQRINGIGALQSAALASNFPFNPNGIASGPSNTTFEIEGRRVGKGELAPLVDINVISSDYFQTIRQPLVKGRTFTEHDDAKALTVAVINQAMARHRWPDQNPIGRRVTFDAGRNWATIVGIVGDVKEFGLGRPVGDEIYLPVDQGVFANNLVLRTALDPVTVLPLVRSALHDVDPQLAIDQVATVERLEHESVASPRVTTVLLGLFAALALVISASGIGAVMALSVSQRRHELGIRMALGAPRSSILQTVVRQGLAWAVAGTVLGIVGAVALTRLLAALLYATSPTDVLTFSAVSLLFFAVAALACFIPARQVTSIDPLIALRQE
ncbi:MAG: ADOP family duplicated permease [Bryobacteraceae bacterium]